MSNSSRPSSNAEQSGLLGWLKKTRVILPLKAVECRFEINGALASVELNQIYFQDNRQPLDCIYQFPMPAGAAVYRCEVDINGRVVRARVEDKKQAERLYKEKKAAGQRALLVEREREDLFTLSLGNLQPEDLVVVRLAWFQMLDRNADELRLMVPTTPGVRYIPGAPLLRAASGHGTADDTDQVPDASRVSPPRIDAFHPDAAYFSIDGRIWDSEIELASFSSPSHPIRLRANGEQLLIELDRADALPDRDLVLCWREPKAASLQPTSWFWNDKDDGSTYALLQLRAPEHAPIKNEASQDFYFLLDSSGSMAGAKWDCSCQALKAFIELLGPNDRVWITLFESTYRDFDVAPLPAADVLTDQGFQAMPGMPVDGGTELLPAVNHVLDQVRKHSASRRTTLILITDGQVGNEAEIIQAFVKAPKPIVHTFGIDSAVNGGFLKLLAASHAGRCWLRTPDDDIAGTIAGLADQLRRPVINDLKALAPWVDSGAPIPDLHAGEIVTLPLRRLRGSSKKSEVRLIGEGNGPIELRCKLTRSGGPALRLLWAKEHIASLIRAGDQSAAIALAKTHNLLCEGTAFVAWDDAEQVVVAEAKLVQPSLSTHHAISRWAALAQPDAPSRLLEEFRDPDMGIWDSSPNFAPPIFSNLPTRSAPPKPDLGELKKKSHTILKAAGFAASTVDEMLAASSSPAELNELERLPDQIEEFRKSIIGIPALEKAILPRLQRMIQAPAAQFVPWFKSIKCAVLNLNWILNILPILPDEAFEQLVEALFVHDSLDEQKFELAREFITATSDSPFSHRIWNLLWRKFLTELFNGKLPEEFPLLCLSHFVVCHPKPQFRQRHWRATAH